MNNNPAGDVRSSSSTTTIPQSSSDGSLSHSTSPSRSSELAVLVQHPNLQPNYHGLTDTIPSLSSVRNRQTSTTTTRTLGFRPITDCGGLAASSCSSTTDNKDLKLGTSSASLDLKFLKRFLKLHYLLFSSSDTDYDDNNGGGGGRGRENSLCSWLFLLLVALCLLNEYIIYHVGFIASKYYKVLGDKDSAGFWRETLIAGGIITAVALVKSTKQFVQKLLTAGWRQALTKTIHVEYFKNLHYFKLNVLDQLIDNPDQRMTQDVDKFTSVYCDILPKFILAPFLIGYYSYEAFTKSGWQGPVSCFGFFVVGALVNRLLMGPVVKYVIRQEKFEGDFRFIHMLVRLNSESLAFHNGAEVELQKTNKAFDSLISTQYRLYLRQYFLNIAINLFDYFGSILSYLLLAIPIFSGVYDELGPTDLSTIISQNSFVTMYLIFQFTSLVDVSLEFADVTGVAHRIGELLERLQGLDSAWEEISRRPPSSGPQQLGLGSPPLPPPSPPLPLLTSWETDPFSLKRRIREENMISPIWSLNSVSFSRPNADKCILRDLTLTINTNESLLITGPSSAGKSSLFRVLRGLWPLNHGSITTSPLISPNTSSSSSSYYNNPYLIYYAPQKSYLTSGSLREQIMFPSSPSTSTSSSRFSTKSAAAGAEDDWMRRNLSMLDLSHLLDRAHGNLDEPIERGMYESLSPGEIQRLCALRIFYHEPLLALMDESTSALPSAMETLIYEECQRLKITTVSVGHRDGLRAFHDKELRLVGKGGGGWSVYDLRGGRGAGRGRGRPEAAN